MESVARLRSDCRLFDVFGRIKIGFARAETADVDSLRLHRLRLDVDRKRERWSQLRGSDRIAACLMCSGVSKSGSPAPKPQTSIPSAFIAFALLSIESVSDGVSCAARSEISMSILSVKIQGNAHYWWP